MGTVRDETGGALPGVTVELLGGRCARRGPWQPARTAATGSTAFRPGTAEAHVLADQLRDRQAAASIVPAAGRCARGRGAVAVAQRGRDGHRSADVRQPRRCRRSRARTWSASRSLPARARSPRSQLAVRPIMRAGEVLETIPGVVISQHSGEGKANQYYLRGFNLDHGTDFATTVAGMPVNMPTHGHGHGYSDLELPHPRARERRAVRQGPVLRGPGRLRDGGLGEYQLHEQPRRARGPGRRPGRTGSSARSWRRRPALGRGTLLAAFEAGHNDGPWVNPDDFRKLNGLVRYTQGDTRQRVLGHGHGIPGHMGLRPIRSRSRAVEQGLVDRFGALDPTDGGDSYRYSGSFDWHADARQRRHEGDRVRARLRPQPVLQLHVPPRRPRERRPVPSGRSPVRERRQGDAPASDAAGEVAPCRTRSAASCATTRSRRSVSTAPPRASPSTPRAKTTCSRRAGRSSSQNEMAWSPTLRTLVGLRADAYRFDVASDNPLNSGAEIGGHRQPEGWRRRRAIQAARSST